MATVKIKEKPKTLETESKIKADAKEEDIKPTQSMVDINLAGEGKKNIGEDKCNYFNMPSQFNRGDVIRDVVSPKIQKWDMSTWRKELSLINKKKSVIRKNMLVLSGSNDPFDTRYWSSFPTRYLSSLVYHIYPGDTKFHARQLHYHLLQASFCFPMKKGSIWELEKYDGSKSMWENLQKYLKTSRYSGLIPMWKQVDKRTTSIVEPENFGIKKEIENDPQTMDLDFNLSTGGNLKVDIETPVIVIYTEKSEMAHVLKELAKKYYLGYFVAQGQSSIPNARDIYEFIKKHGKSGIILTMTDYDLSGMYIVHALSRKIQYFVQNESDINEAPNVVIYPFKINMDDAKLFEELGLAKQYKKGKDGKMHMFYELIALEMLAVLYGLSLEDYLENELKRIFFYSSDPKESWLVGRDTFKKYYETERDRMYSELTSIFKVKAKQSKAQLLDENIKVTPSTTYLQFEEAVRNRMKESEGYKVLQSTVNIFQFKPDHITSENKKEIDNQFGFGKGDSYHIGKTKLKRISSDEIKEDSILWLGDRKYDYKQPTIKMNEWIEKNEKNNQDFDIKDKSVYDEHLDRIQEIFRDKKSTETVRHVIGSIDSMKDKDRAEHIEILSNPLDTIRQWNVSEEIANMLKAVSNLEKKIYGNKYGNYEDWVLDNEDIYLLDQKGHSLLGAGKKLPEDMKKKGFLNFTVGELSKKGKKNKAYNKILKRYFDEFIPFFEKQGKALKESKKLESKSKDLLRICQKAKDNLKDKACQTLAKSMRNVGIEGKRIRQALD